MVHVEIDSLLQSDFVFVLLGELQLLGNDPFIEYMHIITALGQLHEPVILRLFRITGHAQVDLVVQLDDYRFIILKVLCDPLYLAHILHPDFQSVPAFAILFVVVSETIL